MGSTSNSSTLDDTDALGFLSTDPAPSAYPAVDMADPDQTQTPGFLQSLESFGSKAVATAEAGVKTAYGAGKTVVGDVVDGAEGVVDHAVGTTTGAVTSLTGNIVLILAVVGLALVFIARSGAIKATVSG